MFRNKKNIKGLTDRVRSLEIQNDRLNENIVSLRNHIYQLKHPPSFNKSEKVLINKEHYILIDIELEKKFMPFCGNYFIYRYDFINLNSGKKKSLKQNNVNEMFPDKKIDFSPENIL